MNIKKYQSVILFILGFGIFIFTRMSKLVPTIPVSILIASVFILRFSRILPAGKSIILTLLGFILSINIGLWGLFGFNDELATIIFNIIRSSLIGILCFIPYLADRLIYPKFRDKEILSTLTFPVITTAVFFLSSLEGPFDGAIQISKFVYGPLILKQLMSLFGIGAFVFITSWLASIVNSLWENKFNIKKTVRAAIIFLPIVLLILVYGIIKIYLIDSKSNKVKIASIILVPENGKVESIGDVFTKKQTSPFEESILKIENLTKKAASNKAKIVSFQEFSMLIGEDDEEKLKDEYKRIAEENNLYLSISYAYFAKKGKGKNIHLLIDNKGKILLEYTKRYLFGFGNVGENSVFVKGPEIIQSADTPYGKIGISICRDMEFPAYARQAGRDNVDIMLNSSSDWPKDLVVHSVYMRAIENGFSYVRPTYNGISFAVDYNGKLLNSMDSDKTKDGIMYADVPIKGIKTLYLIIGDIFSWICVLGFLLLIILSFLVIIRKKKK